MILPHLKSEIITYAEACKRASLHHSDKRDGEVFDILPYYNEIDSMKRFLGPGTGHKDAPRDTRYGRIANPTVHIGLNQLRRLINSLIRMHGRPDEIVLELSREIKKSKLQKDKAKRDNDQNRKANDSRRLEMEKSGFYEKGDRIRTREALERIRLWEELGRNPNDRVCPYSGKPIQSLSKLLSDEIEIEHILPRSISLDDSPANKTIAYREWNRLKRNLTPAEAAQRFPDKFNQDDMIYRSRNMPLNKKWRFGTDARERLGKEDKWQDRLLKETQHFAVVAGHYLKKLAPADVNREEMSVWVTSGRLTSELRRKWGLHTGTNQKNRNDHRHHALDAAVIGVTDRSLINRLSRAAAQDERQEFGRVLANIPEPFEGFTDQVNTAVKKVIVSHRASHRIAGKLHLDGAYGKVKENPTNIERGEPARGNLVIRRDILSLKPNMIEQVRDEKIRHALQQILHETKETAGAEKKAFEKALAEGLAEYSRQTGTRRVRCLYPKENAIPVGKDKQGNRYKYVVPAENHHVDIVELDDGNWQAVWVDIFEANQAALAERKGQTHRPKWLAEHPDAKFIMRLHKGDTLQLLDDDGVNRVKVVVSLRASLNIVQLAEHLEAGILQKRHDDPDDPFRWDFANIGKLKARRARRVRIDETGRIRTVEHGRI
jgi:CRISPR-associated endonuclease Csn1